MSERIIGKKPLSALLEALQMEPRHFATGPGWKTIREIMAEAGIARCTADTKVKAAIGAGRMEEASRRQENGRVVKVYRLSGKH